ncbi:MAG: hypothetical protein ACREO9_11545, partial [Lysobacterales bacterium]
HQHQRPVRTMLDAGQAVEYVEVLAEDIARANALAHEALGRSLDELPPQTRRMFTGVHALVRQKMAAQGLPQRDIRFSRSEVRAATGLSDTQARIHLDRLAALEYLLTHRGQRGQSFEYELLHDQASTEGQAARPHLSGLIDTRALQASPKTATTNQSSRGVPGELAGSTRPQNGASAGDARTGETSAKPHGARLGGELPESEPVARATPTAKARASYLQSLAA